MAIVLLGKSICPICKNILNEGEDVTGFPHFIANTKDPLYIFTDSGVHTNCFLQQPHALRAMKYADRQHEVFMQKKCTVTGEQITHHREYLALPLLTSDEAEPLFKYNFLTFKIRNIPHWEEREDFVKTAERFIADGKWADLMPEHKFWERIMKYFQ